MEKKVMGFCPNCFFVGKVVIADENAPMPKCPKCRKSLENTLFTAVEWDALSEEQKENSKESWRECYNPEYSAKHKEEIEREQEEAELNKKIASVMITSGYNFEGYRIVKYSGYISGDDVIQINRGHDGLFSSATNVGSALTDSLTKIRSQALKELKEAAFDLGCNAVIGVDFDYITLDPQTANYTGGTTYLPYVFCVTANGTAVKIEKE